MRYAVEETVYRHCFNEEFFDPLDPDNDGVISEIEQIEEGVAALIDLKCNRTFGASPKIEARVVTDYLDKAGVESFDMWLMPLGDPSRWALSGVSSGADDVFILPWGVRNVTAVTVSGDWDGTVWANEVTLDPSYWMLMYVSEHKDTKWAHGIRVSGAYHGTSVRVYGEWQDGAESTTVPPEIREAATFIVSDMYRTRELSPAGEIGPNGLASYVRNVWEEPMVKEAIARNTFRQLVI